MMEARQHAERPLERPVVAPCNHSASCGLDSIADSDDDVHTAAAAGTALASARAAARTAAPGSSLIASIGVVFAAAAFAVVDGAVALWVQMAAAVCDAASLWAPASLRAAASLVHCVARWPEDAVQAAAILTDHLWFVVAFLISLPRSLFFLAPLTLERRCFGRAFRLDPPTQRVSVRWLDTARVNNGKDVLRATLWTPAGVSAPLPTVILRNPYGNHAVNGVEWGQVLLAERGFAVLLQDTRGRFGSDGEFVPVEHEREDGAATVRWARAQPWCDGRVAVFGISYLGLTAWACVGGLKSGELQAAVPIVAQSRVHSIVFREGGGFSLELIITWLTLVLKVMVQRSVLALLRTLFGMWRTDFFRSAAGIAPLNKLDEQLLGYKWPFFQQALAEPHADGPFWRKRDVLCELRPGHEGAVVPPPVHIVSCWYDFFCTQAMHDYELASLTQPRTKLTVLPCSHWGLVSLEAQQLMFRKLVEYLDEHLPAGETAVPRPMPPLAWYDQGRSADELLLPVQLCMLGSRRWRGFAAWPPQAQLCSLYPNPAGHLWRAPPSPKSAVAMEYTYAPENPTPANGGASFNPLNTGSQWQHSVEVRDDVLIFTSVPLAQTLAIAGRVKLNLRVASSARSIDFLGRLCLVSRLGVSTNLCEGKVRLNANPSEEQVGGKAGVEILIELGPVAAEFAPGTRIRLHVCSAAHPRWMRNLCSDPEVPLSEQTSGEPAQVAVWVNDSASRLLLPVVP